MTGLRWDFNISEIKGRHVAWRAESKPPRVIILELTERDALALATVLTAAANPGPGRKPLGRVVPIMPEVAQDDDWLTTADVARRVGVTANTINSWLTRHGPKSCPFPQAAERVNYRNYWLASVIDRWQSEWRKPSEKSGRVAEETPGRRRRPTHGVPGS